MTKPNQQLVRVENMRCLVSEFRKRELTKADIRQMFSFSDSGVRSYIFELEDAHVIEIARRVKNSPRSVGNAVYTMTSDQEVIERFLAKLGTKPPKSERDKRGHGEIATGNPSRHIYAALDGTVVRVPKIAPAQPDPLALAPDFFKPSTEFLERRSVPRDEQPRPTGFAALTVHFSRVAV